MQEFRARACLQVRLLITVPKDTIVFRGQMLICRSSILESLHTLPAYMGLAHQALHMLAAEVLLDCSLAAWTGSYIVLLLPFLKCCRATYKKVLVFLTANSVMHRCLAACADSGQASVTQVRRLTFGHAVDVGAVRCWAILICLKARANESVE